MNEMNIGFQIVVAILFSAAFAYVIAVILQWCWDEWHYLDECEDDEEFEEEQAPLLLLTHEPFEIGDIVFDTITSECVTFAGTCWLDDNEEYAVCLKTLQNHINVYHCPMGQLMKVAD